MGVSEKILKMYDIENFEVRKRKRRPFSSTNFHICYIRVIIVILLMIYFILVLPLFTV